MRRVHAVLTVLACLLLVPAAAGASGRSVVRDCTDNGKIDSHHSQSDYKTALSNLPSDVDEYTDCRSIISAARNRDAKSSGGGGGGGGGTGIGTGGGGGFNPTSTTPPVAAGPTAAEQKILNTVPQQGGGPVPVAGEPITPGGSGLTEAAFRHDVPGPLLALLVLLGLGALAMTVSGARARGLHAPAGALRLFDRVFPRRA